MTLPNLFLGFILCSLYGAVFHFWRGGGGGRLLLFIFLSWIGFWLGHLLANSLMWDFGKLGALQLGAATVGSATFLFIGNWLSKAQGKGQT